MTLHASRTTRYASIACAAALAGIIACGGGESTGPDAPGAADLPIVYSYSADGGAPGRDLFLTSADGRTMLALPDLGGDEAHPDWKPDGRELLVSRTTSTTQVLLVDQQGATIRTVPDVDGMARWSPDGAWIAFTNAASSLLGIVRPDGSGRRLLANVGGGARIAHPSWGRSGDIAFTFGADEGPNEILWHEVDVAFGGAITTGPDDQWPAWSPDGQMLAFSMGLPGPGGGTIYEIGLVNVDGSLKRQLTTDQTAINRAPTWSPDGKWVLYEHWDRAMTTCSFVRIAVTGGAPITVVPGKPNGACGGASWR